MQDEELARLRDAFSHRCVSARLGYADVLFLGFGEPDGAPLYWLDSNFACWRVEGLVLTERTAAVESLIGAHVEAWELSDRLGLRLVFSGSKVLVVDPWPVSDGVGDAWSLSAPDQRLLAVSNDGRTVIVPAETPIRDWFRGSACT